MDARSQGEPWLLTGNMGKGGLSPCRECSSGSLWQTGDWKPGTFCSWGGKGVQGHLCPAPHSLLCQHFQNLEASKRGALTQEVLGAGWMRCPRCGPEQGSAVLGGAGGSSPASCWAGDLKWRACRASLTFLVYERKSCLCPGSRDLPLVDLCPRPQAGQISIRVGTRKIRSVGPQPG